MTRAVFLSLALALSGLLSSPVPAQNQAVTGEKNMVSAASFVRDYEKRDRACDPTLISMYDDNAYIESEIERKDEPLIKKVYTIDQYKAMITTAFSAPDAAEVCAETVYDAPRVKAQGDNECRVEFTASHADSAMRITWLLRKNAAGDFKIIKEQSLTYRRSLGAAKQSQLDLKDDKKD